MRNRQRMFFNVGTLGIINIILVLCLIYVITETIKAEPQELFLQDLLKADTKEEIDKLANGKSTLYTLEEDINIYDKLIETYLVLALFTFDYTYKEVDTLETNTVTKTKYYLKNTLEGASNYTLIVVSKDNVIEDVYLDYAS